MDEITYTQVGDYLLQDIILAEPPNAPPIGRYGTMHKEYLRREKPTLYAALLLSERLSPRTMHLRYFSQGHRIKLVILLPR